MFHAFSGETEENVDAICSHISRHFEPVSLSRIVNAMDGREALPDNAVTVTVDDGYRNFRHGHAIFKRHHIPVTLYAVAAFSAGQLWLWTDQIEFGIQHTTRKSLRVALSTGAFDLPLETVAQRTDAVERLWEALKKIPNNERVAFVSGFGALCGVEIPDGPPEGRDAFTGEELRALASEGVEIGCHTETHPILSRVSRADELKSEITGARRHLEEQTGIPIQHFCYPNGNPADINEAVIQAVKDAGFLSAVTCTWGLNSLSVDRFQIRRTPFDSTLDYTYGVELMAGLHM